MRGFLLNVELISLRQNTLSLGLPNGERRKLDLSLRLERDGSHRRLEVALTSSRGAQISILGEGVGDPFTPEAITATAINSYLNYLKSRPFRYKIVLFLQLFYLPPHHIS